MEKNLFLSGAIATTLALLSSCNQSVWNETDSSPGTSQEYITLKALTGKTSVQQTRVAETTTATLQDFTIWGLIDVSLVEEGYIFNKRKVTKTETGGWSYGDLEKWPDQYGTTSDGYQYGVNPEDVYTATFRAISPANSPNLVDGEGAFPDVNHWDDWHDNVFSMVYYTVPTALDLQEDLLIAVAGDHQPGEQISLTFNHLLSKVEFYARSKQSSIDFKIKKVGLKNLYTTGNLCSQNMTQEWLLTTTTGKWPYGDQAYGLILPFVPVVKASKADYIKELGTPVSIAYNANPNHYTPVASGDEGIFILPQQTKLGEMPVDASDGECYVVIEYEDPSNSVASKTCYFPVKSLFKADDPSHGICFEAGRKYRFKITLEDKDLISLNVDCVGDMDYADDDTHNIYLPDQSYGLWPVGSSPSEALGINIDAKRDGIARNVYGLATQTVTMPIHFKGNGIDWRTKLQQLSQNPPVGEEEARQASERFLQEIGLNANIAIPNMQKMRDIFFDVPTKGLKATLEENKTDPDLVRACIEFAMQIGFTEMTKPEWVKEMEDNPIFVDYGTKIRRRVIWSAPDGNTFLDVFRESTSRPIYNEILFGNTNFHKYLRAQAGYDIVPYQNQYKPNNPNEIGGTTTGIVAVFYVAGDEMIHMLGDYFFLYRPTQSPEYGLYKVSNPNTPIDLQDGPEKIDITFTPLMQYNINI
ncbi:MAG: fimbrillin family protein [Mediterranea sp.]|jgi:hypothetical protein|nr:fimbrillin family protein [Mediterranea sp.]